MGRTREIARRTIHEGGSSRLPVPASRPTKRSRATPVPVAVAPSDPDSSDSSQRNIYITSDSSLYETDDDDDVQSSLVPSAQFTISDLTLLNCPICTNPLTIPIYQCEDGHFSCQTCIKDKCVICSKTMGSKRCKGMEKVIESIRTSCKNMEHGCTKKLSFCQKLGHENFCKYTPIECPCDGCGYIGEGKSFYDHYVDVHPDSCKFIKFNRVNSIRVRDELCFLLEEREKRIFFLHRITDPVGSFVGVSTPSNMKFSYELRSGSDETSVNMKSFVLIMPEQCVQPDREKCLLITNSIHSGAKDEEFMLPLQLVIRKVSV